MTKVITRHNRTVNVRMLISHITESADFSSGNSVSLLGTMQPSLMFTILQSTLQKKRKKVKVFNRKNFQTQNRDPVADLALTQATA